LGPEDVDGAQARQETQATLNGTRAATESFVIGRHARPFVIRQPLRQKFPMLGAIETILAMACVLLRNRSGPISIPSSLPWPCLDSLLCTLQMLPVVNVAPNIGAHAVRGTRHPVRVVPDRMFVAELRRENACHSPECFCADNFCPATPGGRRRLHRVRTAHPHRGPPAMWLSTASCVALSHQPYERRRRIRSTPCRLPPQHRGSGGAKAARGDSRLRSQPKT